MFFSPVSHFVASSVSLNGDVPEGRGAVSENLSHKLPPRNKSKNLAALPPFHHCPQEAHSDITIQTLPEDTFNSVG